MFYFGLSSVISKVFVADFEHVIVCWERHSTKTIVILILKYLVQQTNTYSKSAVETLKANSRDCASLLTTCSMSKNLFKCFVVYYEHAFVYCDIFAITISFLRFLLSSLNRFHTLIYFYLLSDLCWLQKKPLVVFFKKGVFYNYAIFTGKRPCWGLFLIKLKVCRPATILEKDSDTGVSCEIYKNLQTLFLNSICKRLLLQVAC